jgi:hypothetical protein
MNQTPAPLELKKKGEEKRLIPAAKQGKELKLAAQQSKVFSHKSKYAKEEKLPKEYSSY